MLIGRTHELQWLQSRIGEAWAGEGDVACAVVGPPGIGKSALLRAAVARSGAAVVLDAVGVESERSLAYGALRGLVAALPEGHASIGDDSWRLLSALASGEPPAGASPITIRLAFRGAVDALAQDHRLLLVLDDMQWLDAETIDVVRFLVQRTHGRFAMVVASREPMDGLRCPELRVGPLPAPDARSLLRAVEPGLSTVAVGHVLRLAEGNPLALSVVARGLSPAQRTGSSPILVPTHTAAAADRLFLPAVELLKPAAALAGVVVAAEPSGSLTVVRVALAELGLGERELDELRDVGLVETDGDHCSTVHPLARTELYTAAAAGDRRRVHAALATASTGDEAVWHRAAAVDGVDSTVAAELSGLAMRSWAIGALPSAAAALERAARISPPEQRLAYLGQAAGAALTCGQYHATIRLGDEVLASNPDDGNRASVLLTSAVASMMLNLPLPYAELEHHAVRLAAEHPWWSARLFGFVITGLTTEYRIAEALRVAELSRATHSTPEGWVGSAFAYAVSGDRTRARECLSLAQESDGTTHDMVARVNVRMYLEDLESLEPDLRALMAAPGGGRFPRAFGVAMLADCCVRRGSWAEAREFIAMTHDEAEAGDNAVGRLRVVGLAAWLDAAEGRWDAVERGTAELTELAGARSTGVIKSFLLGAIGFVRLTTGDPAGCIEALQPLLQLARQGQWHEPSHVPFAADLVEAALQVGDRRLAEETVAVLAGQVATSGSVTAEAVLERCRALLAPERAAVHLERAVAAHGLVTRPFETARTQLAVGAAVRDEALLADAAAGFRALGANAWVQRAEAAMAGEAVTAPALSNQQLAVARAAATGATTREIADALFISTKTVEYHLGRLYRHYGVRNRAQLVAALREQLSI